MVAPEPTAEEIAELRAGLSKALPEIPCRYFYDDRGSALYAKITALPEYYPSRTEESILQAHADEIVAAAKPLDLAEIGSGEGTKIRLLLRSMRSAGRLRRCVLFDISRGTLEASARRLASEFPEADVVGVVGDFERDLRRLGPGGGRLLLFLAGTVGNLHPDAVPTFLRRAAAQMAIGDHFLVGLDLVKDPRRLHDAYNDAQGITAEFNRNILLAVNDRFLGDFEPEGWQHVAFYDPERQWIEMRLKAKRLTHVLLVRAGVEVIFRAGEEIRTELSCKYTPETWVARTRGTGLALAEWYTDPERLFALALMRRVRDTLSG